MKLGNFPGRGTVFNVFTVLVGGGLALVLQGRVPEEALRTIQIGLGLSTAMLAVRESLASRNFLIAIFSVVLGGLLGSLIGIDSAIRMAAAQVQMGIPGDSNFVSGLVLASVLFCVGPMTVLGCIQDGVERRIDLLAAKSIMDGFAALMFGVIYGNGVLASALVVGVIQGLLTLLAWPLRALKEDPELLAELSGTGGIVLLAVAASIFEVPNVKPANFVLAIAIAPITVVALRRVRRVPA